MIPRRTFLFLLLSTAVRSENPEGSLRLNVPLWDVGDLYSRISNAFGAASSTPAPQAANSGGAAPWGDYYNALLQEYYNKKQGLLSANEAVAVEPLPLPIPVPVPILPRPPRPLRPLRPQIPNRPWPRPTRKPTRRSTTTRRPTTTTTTTRKTTTTTTASPISTSSSTSTSSVPTTTEAVNSTTIAPTTNSTTSSAIPLSSTTGGSSTTGSFPSGSSTTGISVSKYIRNSTPNISPQATTVNPFYSHRSQLQHASITSPTVLSLEGSSPGDLRPEQQLTVQSPPQSMTTLCHNYPRLCAQPEEAQYVRLTDGFGKPMLLILPGAVETLPLPIVSPISSMPRPFRSRPSRRKKPSRSRYIYRLVKKRNNERP